MFLEGRCFAFSLEIQGHSDLRWFQLVNTHHRTISWLSPVGSRGPSFTISGGDRSPKLRRSVQLHSNGHFVRQPDWGWVSWWRKVLLNLGLPICPIPSKNLRFFQLPLSLPEVAVDLALGLLPFSTRCDTLWGVLHLPSWNQTSPLLTWKIFDGIMFFARSEYEMCFSRIFHLLLYKIDLLFAAG